MHGVLIACSDIDDSQRKNLVATCLEHGGHSNFETSSSRLQLERPLCCSDTVAVPRGSSLG